MVAMLMYDTDQEQLDVRIKMCKDIFAHLSGEQLELSCFSNPESIGKFLSRSPLINLACIRIMGQKEIELLRTMRRQYTQSDFFLIADHTISPMEYLTPDIRAASLLLYPYPDRQQETVLKAFLQDFLNRKMDMDPCGNYIVENQSGKTVIPFDQIYYIEIRERKVYIRLKDKEYSRYDSLDHVITQLPDTFIRCHRSFVFNTRHLDTVRLSENMIYLDHDIAVPLSRSYKQAVKEYMNGLRNT